MTNDPPEESASDFQRLINASAHERPATQEAGRPHDSDKIYSNVEKLQSDLAEERDARREERFIFIVIIVILLDVVFFSVIDNIIGPILLVALELLFLIPLARRLGIDEVAEIMNGLVGRITDGISRND